ncbi:putative alpha beta-hydrolase protein [Lasiodiplodia theobromae]|nr:putative alpha beta-hydrolase protein [Lasiodiplodia theobromae]
MSSLTLVFTSLILLLTPTTLCQSLPTVSTPQGIYRPNTAISGVEQFLGIPFAEPPIGNLRFADPVPYASGNASRVIDATDYGPACVQDPRFVINNTISEDCLKLNVFRPAGTNSTAQLPVMIFIYGGANVGGQAKAYNAPGLVMRGTTTNSRVIVATLNYRTGGLGFLFNSLFAGKGLMNAGLKDQRLALEWLHDNIRAFGGDPARTTIFGQSSGSFNVWMQARYAAHGGSNKNLFRAMIMESGAPASLALRGNLPASGDAYLKQSLVAFGCLDSILVTPGDAALACLRSKSKEELTAVWFNQLSPLNEGIDNFVQQNVGFGVDGVWLDGPDYWNETIVPIPMVIGNTFNDGSTYGLVPLNLAVGPYLNAVVAKDLRTNNLLLTNPVVATYYNHTPAENGRGYNADITNTALYYIGEAVLGDTVHVIPRRVTAAQHSTGADSPGPNRNGVNTWSYRWTQKPPLSVFSEPYYALPPLIPDLIKTRAGVVHASELAYLFGNVNGYPDSTAGDRKVAALIQSMWISFAYSLDPNGHGIPNVPHWDTYNPTSARVFNFEEQGSTTSSMIADSQRLDSYNAYKNAAAQAGLPPLPPISA